MMPCHPPVLVASALTAVVCLACALPANAAENPLGGMQLLPGYVHQPLQGIDSVVGRITKKDGLTLTYEIGSLPQPGGLRLGGQFSDRPKQVPPAQLRWYREQVVHGQPVHLAYLKDNQLMVSFPLKGMNVHTKVENADEMAEALLMLLTYPGPPAKE
ncbi:MAG: hypothetical protein KDA79_20130 [Planctomycetaceae bacterium]|nr:hypothetical protein [Planctomycetaceae bacterium]